jgi:hypothetical protein
MWNITTIRPCDQTPEQAAAARRKHKRKTERARRLAAGATPRKQSLSRTKPWEAEGICRRTWERRRMSQIRGVSQIRADHKKERAGRHETATSGKAQRPGPLAVQAATALTEMQPWSPDGPPMCTQLGYLVRLWEYRKLTSGGIGKVVPGLAACSESRRVAA